GTNQPPRVNPSVTSSSGAPGPWHTPSSDRNCMTVNRMAPSRDRGRPAATALTYNHMVVDTRPVVDRVFHALSDPTRRDIVVRTIGIERSVSALAREYPISF